MKPGSYDCVKISKNKLIKGDKIWITKKISEICNKIKEWNVKGMLFICIILLIQVGTSIKIYLKILQILNLNILKIYI